LYWQYPQKDPTSLENDCAPAFSILMVTHFCGVTNYISSLLTNGFTTAAVTIEELAKGKRSLVMRSWVKYLRSIMVKRDLMRHIYCVCIGEAAVLTNGFTAAVVMIGELAEGKRLLKVATDENC
jgi:hypothetical protein